MVKLPVYKYRLKDKPMFYIKVNINGKQLCKRGFSNKKDAQIFEASLLKDNSAYICRHYLVSDVISFYKDDLKSRVKITTYTQNLNVLNNHIYPYFKDLQISKINQGSLKIFYLKTLDNKSYKDKNKIFMVARDFLNYLKEYGLTNSLNLKILKAPYNSASHIKIYNYYTREDFNKFISVCSSKRYRLIFLLLFNYGLRIGELLALKHSDFSKDALHVQASITSKCITHGQMEVSTKNASSNRVYPMLEVIRNAYIDYLNSDELHDSEYVFSNGGKYLTIGETPIRAYQKRLEKLSGVKHIKLHEFRHSCATELINYGFTPEQVASWLGHKSSVTTLNTYFHLFPAKKAEIANYYNALSRIKN